MKIVDLTGKTIGRLTVIGRSSEIGVRHLRWECVCECGVRKTFNGDALKYGKTKSCGCYRRQKGAWNKGIIGRDSHSFRGFEGIPAQYFNEVKYKAKDRGLCFELSMKDLWDLFVSQMGRCAFTGLPLEFFSKGKIPDNSASLDRIESTEGYVIGNVQWVDRRINFMKQQMRDEDFISMCKLVALHHERRT